MSAENVELGEEPIVGATESGLDENVAGALCYLLGLVTGVAFYFVEPDNEFVRFHAAQSVVLSLTVFVLGTVASVLLMVLVPILFIGDVFATGGVLTGIVSLLFVPVALLVSLGTFGLWVFLMLRAYQGRRPRIPIVASVADRLA